MHYALIKKEFYIKRAIQSEGYWLIICTTLPHNKLAILETCSTYSRARRIRNWFLDAWTEDKIYNISLDSYESSPIWEYYFKEE